MYNKTVKKVSFIPIIVPMLLSASIMDIQNLYDQKKYVEAIKEAQNSTTLYGDKRLHILWGQSAEAMGNYEDAMSAYERVLMITPENSPIRIKLAKLYTESERTYLTKQLSEDTEDYQLSIEEKDSIRALVQDDDKPLNAFVSIGFGYDSNINVSPGDIDIPTSEEKISTTFLLYQAGLSYTYKPEDMDNIYLLTSAAFSYQDNAEDYFNLFAGVANAGFGYKNDVYDLYVPLRYSRVYYLNRDLMESIGVNPNLDFVVSKSLIANFSARYTERNFIEENDQLMNDSVWGAGAGLYWISGEHLAFFKVKYDDYSAEYRDLSQYIEKNAITLSLGGNYQLNDLFTVSGAYQYKNTSYDDVIPLSDEKRSDDYHKLDLKLSAIVMEDVQAILSYSYADNRSNYNISEYDKNIVMFNFKYVY
ncbi:surface lipoprotein assembly modifier [Sulfurovum sp.]|uniref:surface lipoprotein assembly modifier n=1 Tax=Sulfurovum sp. TaxID=1969726 RepID=UPI002867B19D|nr:surface lipoprotein assembly modifier [Sulfurovum sp.]